MRRVARRQVVFTWDPPMIEPAMERLRADIGSGARADRHRDLLGADRIDYGYRLLVAG
jgi:hypothetical protein